MAMTIRIGIILLSFACCCHLRQFCSSYFTFSPYLKQSSEQFDSIAEFKADTELTCALRCSTKHNCDEAIFNRDSKKCSLYQKKDKGSIDSHAGKDNTRSRIVTMKKVSNIFLVNTWQMKISLYDRLLIVISFCLFVNGGPGVLGIRYIWVFYFNWVYGIFIDKIEGLLVI